MVDLHVLEGTLQTKGTVYDAQSDQGKYYEALFDKYGITQEEFDSCLSWYTVHPKKFERIYINVAGRIEGLTNDVSNRKFNPVDSTSRDGEIQLWGKATKYVFTNDSARNYLNFEFQNVDLLPEDMYILSFLHRLAPSDSSKNPHAVMYVNYFNGDVDSIYTKSKNDSVLRRYTLKFKARKMLKVKSISGSILGNDSAYGKMNAYVDSIKLVRKFQTFMQDSIRKEVVRVDTTSGTEILPNGMPKKLEKGLQQKESIEE